MLSGKGFVFVSGASVLVFALGVGNQYVRDLVHERDMYKALAERPHQTTPAPPVSAQPTAPAAGPGLPSPSPSPGVIQIAAALGHAAAVVVPPPRSHAPSPSPRPSGTPRPRPLLSVRVEVHAPKIGETP